MAFVSLSFLIFIAIVIFLYFICPLRFRWVVLLVASYVFFWLNSEYLVLVLFGQTLVTYFIALWIDRINRKNKDYLAAHKDELSSAERKELKNKGKAAARAVLRIGILIDLGVLLFLKYYNFFAESANVILTRLGVEAPELNLLLPIGISFYTLQAIAYMTDVYRGKSEADRNLPKFMLFMSFFPQILQGPIARYNHLAHQLYEGHKFDYQRFCYGAQLILWGFMKKLIIADRIGIPVDQIFDNYKDYSGMMIFLAGAGYGVQVYADFSGGMDIARGVAQIMGIDLELNFNQPYFSTSIEDFWRRWHITLGGWMRDYVFYPLSLSKSFNRLGKTARKYLGNYLGKRLPTFIAMFIVFFLVGFWHGSSWRYIAYGVWNGLFISTSILFEGYYTTAREKLRIEETSFSWRLFQMIRTFVICSIGRLFPRAARLATSIAMMQSMTYAWWDLSFLTDGSLIELGLSNANWYLLSCAILVMFFVDYLHEKGVHIREEIGKQQIIFRWVIYLLAIFAVLIFGVYGPAYDSASFIYEQF